MSRFIIPPKAEMSRPRPGLQPAWLAANVASRTCARTYYAFKAKLFSYIRISFILTLNITTMDYYRKCKLHSLTVGDKFYHQDVEFELIYDQHAIMVGLTIAEHEGQKRIAQFADDQQVLVKISEPINVSANA